MFCWGLETSHCDVYEVITIPFLAVCVLVMLLLLIDFISKSLSSSSRASSSKRAAPTRTRIRPVYIITTATSMITFLCSTGIDLGDLVYYAATGVDAITIDHAWLIVLTNIASGIAIAAFYCLSFMRLYFTFKCSAYPIRAGVVRVMATMIVLNTLILFAYSFAIFVFYSADTALFYRIQQGLFLSLTGSDLLLSLTMLSLFVYKLEQTAIGQAQATICFHKANVDEPNTNRHSSSSRTRRTARSLNNGNSAGSGTGTTGSSIATTTVQVLLLENGHGTGSGCTHGMAEEEEAPLNLNLNLSPHQTKILSLITRITLLSSLVILFNQFFFTSIVVGSAFPDGSNAQNFYYLLVVNSVKATLGVVNACGMYLNFAFNSHTYFQCCSRCHNAIYHCFVTHAQKQITRTSLLVQREEQD